MRRLLLNLFFLIVLMLSIISCEHNSVAPRINYEPELNVFALLILNNQQKVVRVEQSYRVDEYLPENSGITNARVTIESETQSIDLVDAGMGNYRDITNSLKLAPGERYNLKVVAPDGREVTGSCVMPGVPQITSPKEYEEVRAHQALHVQWREAEYAHRYMCLLYDLEKDFTPQQLADTTAIDFFAFLFADADVYTLKVVAADQNYYDHIRTGPRDEAIVHLQGGLGVFGAIAYDQINFVAK